MRLNESACRNAALRLSRYPRDFATVRPIVVMYRMLKTQLVLLDELVRQSCRRSLEYEFLSERMRRGEDAHGRQIVPDGFPQVFYDVGFSAFAELDSRDRLKRSGLFASHVPSDFALETRRGFGELLDAGPGFPFTVVAAIPLVLLADERLCRGKTMPRSWEDLLDPEWRGMVTVDNLRFYDNNPACLGLCNLLGEEGMLGLLGQIEQSWGNVKSCLNSADNEVAIHVTSLPFAQGCANLPYMHLIVPEEGALVTPILMLAKVDRDAVGQSTVGFFFSERWQALCARSRVLASAGSNVETEPRSAGLRGEIVDLPTRLYWPGWRLLEQFDFEAFNAHVREQLKAHPIEGVVVA